MAGAVRYDEGGTNVLDGLRRREAAEPQSFLVAKPRVAMMIAVVVMMIAVSVAVAIRCVAVTGVHRLLGRCGTH